MAYGNYGNNRGNYGNNRYNNNGGFQQQQPAQQQQPEKTIEEQIAERLDVFQMILQQAEQRGIAKDDLLMSGVTAWVTSMVTNFRR